jgi:tetratricopeptide (TPR) repeat protein
MKSRVFILIGLIAPQLWAQHHAHAPTGPERPVALYKGMGAWRHPIATKSADAQKFFDQGLSLLYGFNRYEALRSFRKAAELDPQSVMAHWGMAMSQGPYINMDGDPSFDLKGACSAVAAGQKIATAPERERAYLKTVAAWCPQNKTPEYKPDTYVAAVRELVDRYPDDLDAQTLLAESLMIPVRWKWYSADGAPAKGVVECERILEGVLRRWPEHPGANHYYIHAVEASPTPERAIASAQRLMGTIPSVGHMVHMPGHIWLILGDWGQAAGVNERAAQVDREYFEATGVGPGSYSVYYIHNVHFILYARMMQGNRVETFRAGQTMSEYADSLVQPIPQLADLFLPMPWLAQARFGDWDGILKITQPPSALQGATAMWHYVRALAFTARGDRKAAVKERAELEKSKANTPPEARAGQSRAVDVLTIAAEIIDARMAATPAAAVPHWRKAVEIQDTLGYDEPPDWYYPVRESLGAALLRAGQASEAEKVLREGVKRSPRNGRMLFALMESLKAQGKTDGAESVRREFEAVWKSSDVKLRIEDL